MAENSKIEWTMHTFNPWRGCTKVSAGCANCYAETLSGRNPGTLGVWGPNGTRVVASESMWREPVKWDKAAKAAGERHRVFCASLADVFEDWRGPLQNAKGKTLRRGDWEECLVRYDEPLTLDIVRFDLFALIKRTPNLDWLLLTKRPENIVPMMAEYLGAWGIESMPNVWLGTSVENQQAADERIPHLLKVPATVRFLSMEPLLGAVDVSRIPVPSYPGVKFDSLAKSGKGAWGTGASIGWVIVGGESGHDARPFDVGWAGGIIGQCRAAGVPVFVKQYGANPVNLAQPLRLRDKKGGDWNEWPEVHRVREFPEVTCPSASS